MSSPAPPVPPPTSPTQVLINDQSTRSCAWGDTSSCTPEIQGTMSGWPRYTAPTAFPPGQEHRDGSGNAVGTARDDAPCGDGIHYPDEGECAKNNNLAREVRGSGGGRNETHRSWSGHYTDSGEIPVTSDPAREGMVVEYRLHEFGLLSPLHGFSHWPGFSLNPALWDLVRLKGSYRRQYGRQFEFDSVDDRSDSCMIQAMHGACLKNTLCSSTSPLPLPHDKKVLLWPRGHHMINTSQMRHCCSSDSPPGLISMNSRGFAVTECLLDSAVESAHGTRRVVVFSSVCGVDVCLPRPNRAVRSSRVLSEVLFPCK